MIATQNQQTKKKPPLKNKKEVSAVALQKKDPLQNDNLTLEIPKTQVPAIYIANRLSTHHPKAGLNGIVDAAAALFATLIKLKQIKAFRHFSKLQTELLQDVHSFQEAIKNIGYNAEYVLVCRHIVCATLDDVISNISWANQGQWDNYRLLPMNTDARQHDKFFTILERVIKEPALYIDLMELMYICLSLGYKGQYHLTEHRQYQLDQVTNNLYKSIRAQRGSFNKSLSPFLSHVMPTNSGREKNPVLFILLTSVCIILMLFLGLEYLLNLISNETSYNLLQLGKLLAYEIPAQ